MNIPVILANDNDSAGIKQNINLAGRLNLSEKSENIHAHLNVNDRTDGRLLITINHQTQQEGQEKIKEVAERFTSEINKSIPQGAEQEAKATTLQNGTRSSEMEIAFTVNRENLIRVEKALIQERGLEKNIQIQRPYEKDYNEDLKKATPFIVAYQENGKEQIAGRYTKEIDAHQAVSEKAQEKPQAQIVAYMEIKKNQESKRVELAQYDRETNKVVATPEFEKRVDEQQKQQDNQQRAQAAASQANAGDIKMVDGDGNVVAKTDYKVDIDSQGHATVRKEQRFDQEELTREGTNGKDLQNAMNKEVANASGQGAGQGGAALKDPHKDISQDQGNKRSMSM